jgi:hypothetical protein
MPTQLQIFEMEQTGANEREPLMLTVDEVKASELAD